MASPTIAPSPLLTPGPSQGPVQPSNQPGFSSFWLLLLLLIVLIVVALLTVARRRQRSPGAS